MDKVQLTDHGQGPQAYLDLTVATYSGCILQACLTVGHVVDGSACSKTKLHWHCGLHTRAVHIATCPVREVSVCEKN